MTGELELMITDTKVNKTVPISKANQDNPKSVNYGSESAVVAKPHRLICAIYFLHTAGDIKRYHCLKTIISLVSGFFLMLCAC